MLFVIQELIFLIIKQQFSLRQVNYMQSHTHTHTHTRNSSHENEEISIVFMLKTVRTRFINFSLKSKKDVQIRTFRELGRRNSTEGTH